MQSYKNISNKKLSAVCGKDCSTCPTYIATHENPEKLKQLGKNYHLCEDEIKCNGCRSIERCSCCEQCKMFDCAWDRGYEFCHECFDYPCSEIKLVQVEGTNQNKCCKDLEIKYFTL